MEIGARKFLFPVIAGVLALGACNDAAITDPLQPPGIPSLAVIFYPETGTGFVGKGDVQLVYGWNNKQLQDNADDVDFRIAVVTETTWSCTKPRPDHPQGDQVQERSRTTTLQGLVTTVARENSKGKNGPVTGFNLEGYDGDPDSETEGPAVGSCPAGDSDFAYDNNAETTQLSGGFQVSINGTDWFDLD